MGSRAARAFHCLGPALAAAAYFAAATTPCVPVDGSGIHRAAQATRASGHASGDSRSEAEATAQVGTPAVIAAPCVCGCGKRAGTASTARLGPVVPAVSAAIAATFAIAPCVPHPDEATSIALAPPDPVPLARFG